MREAVATDRAAFAGHRVRAREQRHRPHRHLNDRASQRRGPRELAPGEEAVGCSFRVDAVTDRDQLLDHDLDRLVTLALFVDRLA
jgi:hypothetical protein